MSDEDIFEEDNIIPVEEEDAYDPAVPLVLNVVNHDDQPVEVFNEIADEPQDVIFEFQNEDQPFANVHEEEDAQEIVVPDANQPQQLPEEINEDLLLEQNALIQLLNELHEEAHILEELALLAQVEEEMLMEELALIMQNGEVDIEEIDEAQ